MRIRLVFLAMVLTAAWSAARLPAVVLLPTVRTALFALNNEQGERFACLYGGGEANGIIVVTHVEPGQVTGRSRSGRFFMTEIGCPSSALGLAHNHPANAEGDRRCWFFFPGTQVPTSDEIAFETSGMALSIIVCGDRLVMARRDALPR